MNLFEVASKKKAVWKAKWLDSFISIIWRVLVLCSSLEKVALNEHGLENARNGQNWMWLVNGGNLNNSIFFEIYTRCLKITGKVSFNIASEASHVYIMRLRLSTVTRLVIFKKTKLVESAELQKLFWREKSYFPLPIVFYCDYQTKIMMHKNWVWMGIFCTQLVSCLETCQSI